MLPKNRGFQDLGWGGERGEPGSSGEGSLLPSSLSLLLKGPRLGVYTRGELEELTKLYDQRYTLPSPGLTVLAYSS